MRVIIAGTRTFENFELLSSVMDLFSSTNTVDEVVSGGAFGADRLGEQWAKEQGIPVKIFKADWNRHGKAAGPIRNEQMAHYADYLVLFWDGESRGSKNMLSNMKKLGKSYKVFNANGVV
jgi:hypothetical protein